MPNDVPDHHRPQLQRREALRIGAAAAAVAFAAGYIVADFDGHTMEALASLVVAVALGMLALWISEMRLARLDRIKARLDRSAYWRVYSDVMNDLGGVDGEASGEIPRIRQ